MQHRIRHSVPYGIRATLCLTALVLAASSAWLCADNVTGVTGQSAALDTRQPTTVMRYMICVNAGIFPDGVDGTPTQQVAPNRTYAFIGEIKPIPFNYVPNGWAMCDGQLLPINQN